ncbi:MAG: UDP-N-acetylmuramoyl-tripeptide--D-alanyl-D-alanine ligase [Bacteroidetes bacterium]|nr:UDP-N-acetylmuramoyl-tripeptide--D-alanyl-D-alanine ligase [Bacteroidota bacterium]
MDTQELYKLFLQHPVVSTDSRIITSECMFFALHGENFDGNLFAEEALQKGASLAIIDNPALLTNERCLLVKDTLESLQQLASFHRMQFSFPVLGITGTNGKTTTKELISTVLQTTFNTVSTAGNLNNHIGVPLTLLRMTSETEMAVIEMGANHPGEIKQLCDIAQPTAGLITNIGKAHLEGFGSVEVIIETKKALYDFIRKRGGTLYINSDNPVLTDMAGQGNLILYGIKYPARFRGELNNDLPFLSLSFIYNEKSFPVKTHLVGRYNFDNVMAAIAVGLSYHIEPERIVTALENYEPANNRSQVYRTTRNLVILDAYNANPSSMRMALESFLLMPGQPKAVILGDMLELGVHAETEHREVINLLSAYPRLDVYLVGPVFSVVNNRQNYTTFKDTASLREYLYQFPLNSRTILVKGSRGIRLEKIIDAL